MPRPREFDEAEVMANATAVFWRNGYAKTSLDDLVAATGLNRSSLYNAFGGKQDIFCAALDHYRTGPGHEVLEPLLTKRGAKALRGFLKRLAKFVESPVACRGCLMVNTALSDTALSPEVQRHVREHFETLHVGIERAYREAVSDGDTTGVLEPPAVSAWLVTFVRGALVSAGSGEDIGTLKRSIAMTAKQIGLA